MYDKHIKKIELIIMPRIAKGFFKFEEFLTRKLGVDWGAKEEEL